MLPDEVTTEPQLCYDVAEPKISKTENGQYLSNSEFSRTANELRKERNGLGNTSKDDDMQLQKEIKERRALRFSGQQVIWRNVIAISILHLFALYGFLTYPYFQRPLTTIWGWLSAVLASFGVGAGVHRLWTHRTYKAKTPLRILLLLFYCSAGMNSVFDWVRDHRVHHKFSETDADPHNSSRGFFFSHVGWLMLRKHPDVLKKGRQIDMSDILADPVVAFGDKYFILLKITFCFILPTLVPVYFWNENWYYAILTQTMRYTYVLNATWCVNSVSHMIGWRPYDKMIAPTENKLIAFMTGGEGWHNYHHVFPWDYKASEFGHSFIDCSTYFIHTFAAIGWAYDLKQPSPELVKSMACKKGDGSHYEIPAPDEETKIIK